MAKRLTKTEKKRLYAAILGKTKKLFSVSDSFETLMSAQDMIAIEKIVRKYQKKL